MPQQFKVIHRATCCTASLLSLILVACGDGSNGAVTNTDAGDSATAAATTTSTPSPPAVATDSDITCGIANFQDDFITLVNAARATGAVCGNVTRDPGKPLVWSSQLAQASKIHSDEMAIENYFAHVSAKTGTLRERIRSTGYEYKEAGENLAGGHTTIAMAVADWVKSPSHCANLLNADFKEMGAACRRSSSSYYKIYWTLELALPED